MTEDKSFMQNFMERFGLEFPEDAKKFVKTIENNFLANGSLFQFFDDLIEAFPEKSEIIMSVPISIDDDRN